MRAAFLLLFASFSTLSAQPKLETGDINGAKFRIDVPANWNGSLIMYCHGYAEKPVTYDDKPNPLVSAFNTLGYAVAQSGYATGGWAVKEATEDTEELRRYFVANYGAVKETFVTGHSMGGFLTMMMMERMAGTYKAGLALCGPLSAAVDFMNRGALDGLVIFNFYFPNVLPEPDKVLTFNGWDGISDKVSQALSAKPKEAEIVRRFGGQKTLKELAGVLVFNAALVRELTVRTGGLPLENQNVVYTVDGGDYNALNEGVKRYKADLKAAAYLAAWYSPTGHLSGPMLAVHTTYDELVPTWIPNRYLALTRSVGSQNLFVQQFVRHDGHCRITPEETITAFQELKRWADGGPVPVGGTVPSNK